MPIRRTGIDPLAYMGVEPSTPAQFVREGRNPTTSDYDGFIIGTVWIVRGTNAVWMLVDKADFIATWIQFTNNIAGVNTLTGNIGGAVPPLAGNINVIGATPYTFSGNPGLNTLTLDDNGTIATIYDTDSGIAIPSANILNVIGGTGVTVTGSGNTITINASSSNLEILTDLGVPVSPDMSILEVYGDENITTTGTAPNIISVSVSGTTNHAVQVGNATGSLTSVGPLATGELLIGVTGSDPNPARLTAGSNITIDDTSTPGEIVISSIGGGGGGIIAITKFTASGTFTKNVNTSYMDVICWNAGSGGGSGRQGVSGSAGGGTAGLPGSIAVISVWATLFDTTETVTIPAGGIGAAAQISANTNGHIGSEGGYSSIGNIFIPLNNQTGTLGGTGGTTGSASQNPNVSIYVLQEYPGSYTFSGRGIGTNNSGTDGAYNVLVGGIIPVGQYLCVGSGGGGGANSISEQSGGNGGNIYPYAGSSVVPSVPLSAGGAGGLESISIDGANGNDMISTMGGRFVGSSGGGGGGGQSIGLVAGNGGDGGIPCSPGAGGGGSLNGTNSGAGGDGARGEIWVIEYA